LTVDRTFNTTSTRYGVVTHARNSSPAQIFGTWSKGELTNWTDGEEWVYGVYGVGSINGSSGGFGGPSIVGVRGYASGGHTAYGVYGEASGAFGNYAGYFHNGIVKMTGDLVVDGTVYKGGGSFRIDHPLDPENKYLQHSFVESPDMMNIYNGNVVLDDNGEATVQMPEWFEPLNRDFRYQLTCIGGFAPVYIADKLVDGRFRIAGGTPGLEVSWQVTGIRQDRWANDNRIPVEVEKTGQERGLYVHPDAYGLDEKRGISSLHVQPAPATPGE
jgi:hypothetical protein